MAIYKSPTGGAARKPVPSRTVSGARPIGGPTKPGVRKPVPTRSMTPVARTRATPIKPGTRKPVPGRMYTGGSKNFNESTGAYRKPTRRPPPKGRYGF